MAIILTEEMEEEIERCKGYMLSVLADQKIGMQKRVLAGTAVACGYAPWTADWALKDLRDEGLIKTELVEEVKIAHPQ